MYIKLLSLSKTHGLFTYIRLPLCPCGAVRYGVKVSLQVPGTLLQLSDTTECTKRKVIAACSFVEQQCTGPEYNSIPYFLCGSH